MRNPETMHATRQWVSGFQVKDEVGIATVFADNEISPANLHLFSLEELRTLGISEQDAQTIRRTSAIANKAAKAELTSHALLSNVVACHAVADDTPHGPARAASSQTRLTEEYSLAPYAVTHALVVAITCTEYASPLASGAPQPAVCGMRTCRYMYQPSKICAPAATMRPRLPFATATLQLESLVLHAVCFATSCRAEFGRGAIEPMLLPAEGEESAWTCPTCIATLVRISTCGIARRAASHVVGVPRVHLPTRGRGCGVATVLQSIDALR